MPLKPIVLTEKQKDVIFLPAIGHLQIKGVAGSGKTSIAIYRAKHLLDTQSNLFKEASVAIFTYNKSLVTYIKNLLPFVSGGYQKDSNEIRPLTTLGLNINVTHFHKWAFDFIESNGTRIRGKIIEEKGQINLID